MIIVSSKANYIVSLLTFIKIKIKCKYFNLYTEVLYYKIVSQEYLNIYTIKEYIKANIIKLLELYTKYIFY